MLRRQISQSAGAHTSSSPLGLDPTALEKGKKTTLIKAMLILDASFYDYNHILLAGGQHIDWYLITRGCCMHYVFQ